MSKITNPDRSYQLALNHNEIAICEWGDAGHQPVVALHGWLDNLASFMPLVGDGRWLKDNNLRLITYDLAGHGYSAHRHQAQGYPFLDNVDDLHQLLERLQLKDPIIMGHSMGGGVATLYSGTNGTNVHKLILIESLGPLTQDEDKAPEQLQKHLLSRYRHAAKEGVTYSNLDEIITLRSKQNELTFENAELIVSRNMNKQGDSYQWRSDPRLRIPSAMYMSHKQVEAFVSNISCPVLLIYASDGPWENYPVLGDRAELLQTKHMVALKGGHHLHMNNADDVRNEVIKFINNS